MAQTLCYTDNDEHLLLQGAQVQGRVVGRMLEMSMTQHFRNTQAKNVEVVYTFPLPWKAVLLGLDVELNGQTYTAQVKAKADARLEYESTLSEGNTGVLVEINKDGSYTLELGNLMAGEGCIVRLRYVQTLQIEQGGLRLVVPTTLAPRYGNPVEDAGYAPHAVPEVDANVEYPFDIRLSVQGELVQAGIASPSHRVSVRRFPSIGVGKAQAIEVCLATKAWLDRDFVLVFAALTHSSLGLSAWDRLDPGLGVVMANFTPRLPVRPSAPGLQLTMKVLVDCSGSMAGDSIRAARAALLRILDGLESGDRFSLTRFGSSVEHRSKTVWKATPTSLAVARRWVQEIEADLGGTEMNNAILSTLALPGADCCDVLLITDGDIHAIDTVIESAEQSKHRFFVVGIGSSVSEGLLRRLAERTGGSSEFVTPGEAVGPAIERLYLRMRSPQVKSARVEWPHGSTPHAVSDLPLSVFEGDDITVFARLHATKAEQLAQPVRLWGYVDGVASEVCIAECSPVFIADDANTLARLAANQRYRQLREMAESAPAILTKQLPALAEKYQLVTQDTSLLMVMQRSDGQRAADMPELRQVRGMLAAGKAGYGSVVASSNSPAVYSVSSANVGSVLPSVWRTNKPKSKASRIEALASGGLDDFEIPASLRAELEGRPKGDGPLRGLRRNGQTRNPYVWRVPAKKPEFWSLETFMNSSTSLDEQTYVGLTPAGLTESLRINDRQLWPSSYQALEKIGLGRRVIDWLEICMAQGLDPESVVTAFLEMMAGRDWTIRQTMASFLRTRAKELQTDSSEVRMLKERMSSVVARTGSTSWPEEVLDFVEAEQRMLGTGAYAD